MKSIWAIFILSLAFWLFNLFEGFAQSNHSGLFRNPVDSIGFPIYENQVHEFISNIKINCSDKFASIDDSVLIHRCEPWKMIIMPHDDYSYVQYIYPAALKQIKAKTIFIIGVAHKARIFNIGDHLVFDSHTYWNAPFGKVKVSEIREQLIKGLDKSYFLINDSLHKVEHSVEPFLPLLQYFNNGFEIVPILVPSMTLNRMHEISQHLADLIHKICWQRKMEWGKDYSIIISNDAVHYGDEDWGGKNLARYGVDKNGYLEATRFDLEIINNCLLGGLTIDKVRKFVNYTVMEDNYKEYKWTWCGRYSVPFGVLLTLHLENLLGFRLNEQFLAYSTSIENPPLSNIPGMGVTAPANLRHWVGYACIAYY